MLIGYEKHIKIRTNLHTSCLEMRWSLKIDNFKGTKKPESFWIVRTMTDGRGLTLYHTADLSDRSNIKYIMLWTLSPSR